MKTNQTHRNKQFLHLIIYTRAWHEGKKKENTRRYSPNSKYKENYSLTSSAGAASATGSATG